ncbi:MAG: ATP synthase F1 subunit epsilon [Eubacteriales bacterium]|nr:ATP synthase F1 subunit epsilon [Eubacteriales bacterium]
MSVFHLKIVTADGEFFDGEAERILVRTIDGDVCILAHHTPYLTALGMGECRVTGSNGETRRAACIGGMLSVMNNEVNLVATTFEWAEDIDVSRAERARQRAEELMRQHLDARDQEMAQARLKRALTRIKVGK